MYGQFKYFEGPDGKQPRTTGNTSITRIEQIVSSTVRIHDYLKTLHTNSYEPPETDLFPEDMKHSDRERKRRLCFILRPAIVDIVLRRKGAAYRGGTQNVLHHQCTERGLRPAEHL